MNGQSGQCEYGLGLQPLNERGSDGRMTIEGIQANAFSGVGTEAIVIHEKCESVSPDAFGDGANLRSVFIPSDLEDSIGDAFDETLEKVFY